MSVAAYTLAVRNHLREYLTNFYSTSGDKARNCKVMVDEMPTADCGQEFISVYGSTLVPNTRNLMQAIDEKIGLTVAISRKIALVPPDRRGELGYVGHQIPTMAESDDETRFYLNWAAVESRCREVVQLVAGPKRYELMAAANVLINETGRHVELDEGESVHIGGPITEPLLWLGSDAAPRQVGAEHFYSFHQEIQDSDPVYGLVMKIYFGDAVRMQSVADFDLISVDEDEV